jgi:hypothetical protein
MWDASVSPLHKFRIAKDKSTFTVDFLIREGTFAKSICGTLQKHNNIAEAFDVSITSNYYFKKSHLINMGNGVFQYAASPTHIRLCDTLNELWWDEYPCGNNTAVKVFADSIDIPNVGCFQYTPITYSNNYTGGFITLPVVKPNGSIVADVQIPLIPRTANHTIKSYHAVEIDYRKEHPNLADDTMPTRIIRMCASATTHEFQQYIISKIPHNITTMPWPEEHSSDFNLHGAELIIH